MPPIVPTSPGMKDSTSAAAKLRWAATGKRMADRSGQGRFEPAGDLHDASGEIEIDRGGDGREHGGGKRHDGDQKIDQALAGLAGRIERGARGPAALIHAARVRRRGAGPSGTALRRGRNSEWRRSPCRPRWPRTTAPAGRRGYHSTCAVARRCGAQQREIAEPPGRHPDPDQEGEQEKQRCRKRPRGPSAAASAAISAAQWLQPIAAIRIGSGAR